MDMQQVTREISRLVITQRIKFDASGNPQIGSRGTPEDLERVNTLLRESYGLLGDTQDTVDDVPIVPDELDLEFVNTIRSNSSGLTDRYTDEELIQLRRQVIQRREQAIALGVAKPISFEERYDKRERPPDDHVSPVAMELHTIAQRFGFTPEELYLITQPATSDEELAIIERALIDPLSTEHQPDPTVVGCVDGLLNLKRAAAAEIQLSELEVESNLLNDTESAVKRFELSLSKELSDESSQYRRSDGQN